MTKTHSSHQIGRIILRGFLLLFLILLFSLPAAPPVQAQTYAYGYTFDMYGPITIDNQYNYTSPYNDETDVGCWGNYANNFGNGFDNTRGSDGYIIKWGLIDSTGKMSGGCSIPEDPINGYDFEGTVTGGTYNATANSVTGFVAHTTEKISFYNNGSPTWGLSTLDITANLSQKPGGSNYELEGEAHFVLKWEDSQGNKSEVGGTQKMEMSVYPITVQPATSTPMVGGAMTIAAMGCYEDPKSPGTVICIPTIINLPSGTTPSLTWTLDGQSPSSTSGQIAIFKEISPGEHTATLVVAAGDQTTPAYKASVMVFNTANKPAFKVKVNCAVSGTPPTRSASCSATPSGPGIENLTYQWYADGNQNQTTGATLSLSNLDARQYAVQVRATDSSGKSLIEYHVIPSDKKGKPAPLSSGQAQVSSPSGAAVVNPGQGTNVPVKPGQTAQVKSKCNLDDFLWASLLYGNSKYAVTLSNGDEIDVRFLVVYMLCIQKEGSTNPGSPFTDRQGSFIPVGYHLPQSSSDAVFQAEIDVPAGPLRLQVTNDQASFTIDTPNTVVTTSGAGDFEVAYDPSSGQTTVAAYQGSLQIQPQNPNLQPLSLSDGQMVQITQDNVGAINPVTTPPTSTSSNTTIFLILVVCCCGVVMAAIIIVIVVLLLRKRSRKTSRMY
jgi:hypothetical protein